jgi:phosphatidate cytidylyltransferase
MTQPTRERLFGLTHAFDSAVVRGVMLSVAVVFVVAPILIVWLQRRGKLAPSQYEDLMRRYRSWLVLGPLMVVPILLGAFWTILAIGILSILCYREYARATGLFRERLMSALLAAGIVIVTLSVLDHWYELFMALFSLTVGVIAAAAVLVDRPRGYIQRVALAIFAFVLFGVCLGHLAFFANDAHFRPILVWLIICVEMNDVFAYVSGKTFGRRKLAPHTSPNKTIGGAIGALVLTTALVAVLGHAVFHGSVLDRLPRLILLGLIVSICGQLGDLLISSIKRDLELKDMGTLFPGHGGWLDRFDSLILVAPAVFHYIRYFRDIGVGQQIRIFSGGW